MAYWRPVQLQMVSFFNHYYTFNQVIHHIVKVKPKTLSSFTLNKRNVPMQQKTTLATCQVLFFICDYYTWGRIGAFSRSFSTAVGDVDLRVSYAQQAQYQINATPIFCQNSFHIIFLCMFASRNVSCHISLLCIDESQAPTAPRVRKTPMKGSYSSLRIVITKKQYSPGLQGCYLSYWIIPFI